MCENFIHERQAEEVRRRMEETTDAGTILRHAGERNGAALHRRILGLAHAGYVRLRLLRAAAFPLHGKVRIRFRVAEFLGPAFGGQSKARNRCQPRNAPHRSDVRKLRRAPRPRLRRRARTYRDAILHQFRIAQDRSRKDQEDLIRRKVLSYAPRSIIYR